MPSEYILVFYCLRYDVPSYCGDWSEKLHCATTAIQVAKEDWPLTTLKQASKKLHPVFHTFLVLQVWMQYCFPAQHLSMEHFLRLVTLHRTCSRFAYADWTARQWHVLILCRPGRKSHFCLREIITNTLAVINSLTFSGFFCCAAFWEGTETLVYWGLFIVLHSTRTSKEDGWSHVFTVNLRNCFIDI